MSRGAGRNAHEAGGSAERTVAMNVRRLAVTALTAGGWIVALSLLAFALPIPLWRTGEHPAPALVYRQPAPSFAPGHGFIWIDTDAACGTGRHRDPDDCLALFTLVVRHGHRLAGLSTVFGNAPLEATDATARALAATFGPEAEPPGIWRGCAVPVTACDEAFPRPDAHDALAAALRDRPLTFVALGPLTNLAAVLRREPALAGQLVRVIAVMGRRPGHIFHPAEGRGEGAVLFGHGPIFRDLNAELDPRAVEVVVDAGVELVLLPYAAARGVVLTDADLGFIAAQGRTGQWVAQRSRGWLDFWRRDVGIDGFYPFDLLASAYLDDPSLFRCADVIAWVGRDPMLPLYPRTPALLVAQQPAPSTTPRAVGRAIYCDGVSLDVRSLFATR